jgi:phosphoglycolate phosphatase-like HAD superfamily hydrolase
VNKLILWDIDGTLMTTGGVAAAAMRDSMTKLFGAPPPSDRLSYAGKTDSQIILETYPAITPADLALAVQGFGESYAALLHERRALLEERTKAMPGVPTLLRELVPHARQGVLTGNMAHIARLKLSLLDLLDLLDLEASAFGDDHHHRPNLLPIAATRAARRFGRPFAPTEIVVVGDTPNDIACGKAGGARTVAVATGSFTVEQLATYQPDAVLATLSDPGALAAILG